MQKASTPKECYEDYQVATGGRSAVGERVKLPPWEQIGPEKIGVIEGWYCVAVGAALRAGLPLPPIDPRIEPGRALDLVKRVEASLQDPFPPPPALDLGDPFPPPPKTS